MAKLLLDKHKDWMEFEILIEGYAQHLRCWKYVDPNKPEVKQPERPEIPKVSDFESAVTTYAALTDKEKNTYKEEMRFWEIIIRDWKETDMNLQAVRAQIMAHLAPRHIYHTQGKNSPYELMMALSKVLKPTKTEAKDIALKRWQRALVITKKENIEEWLIELEKAHNIAVKAKVSALDDHADIQALLNAAKTINITWATAREIQVEDTLREGKEPLDFNTLLNSLRSIWFQDQELSAKYAQHHAFGATLNNEQVSAYTDRDAKEQKTCLCKETHRFKQCPYINPSKRDSNWKPEPAIKRLVLEKVKGWKFKGKPDSGWFTRVFGYDGFDDTPTDKEKERKPKAAAPAYHVFSGVTNGDFKLYNAQLLDPGSDIHICNDIQRANFKLTHAAPVDDYVISGKAKLQVEAYGTMEVNLNGSEADGDDYLLLKNVALVPGYMSNLVALQRLMDVGIHWNTENPLILNSKGKVFCKVYRLGDHYVLEKNSPIKPKHAFSTLKVENLDVTDSDINTSTASRDFHHQEIKLEHAAFATLADPKSKLKLHYNDSRKPRQMTITAETAHQIFGHAAREAIHHLENTVADIVVDKTTPAPKTIQCETCSLAKAKEIVSRRYGTEAIQDPNKTMFDAFSWDIIEMEVGFNGHRYCHHFTCLEFDLECTFTSTHKGYGEAVAIFEEFWNIAVTQFKARPRRCKRDGEASLGNEYRDFVIDRGLKDEVTAADTSEQNPAESAGKRLVIRSRCACIAGNLPHNLWPVIVCAESYAGNRTPLRKLGWKCPWYAATGVKPKVAHMVPLGTKAYALQKDIPKLMKLLARALIGYLVGYDSTNIFLIWIASLNKVIRTRDVTFQLGTRYDLQDLDVGVLLPRVEADYLITAITIPDNNQLFVSIPDTWEEIFPIGQQSEYKLNSDVMPTVENVVEIRPEIDITKTVDIGLRTPSLTKSPEPIQEEDDFRDQDNSSNDIANDNLEEMPISESLAIPEGMIMGSTGPTAVSADVSQDNIVTGRREKRQAHTALHAEIATSEHQFDQIHHAFAAEYRDRERPYRIPPTTNYPHISDCPPPPKYSKDLETHMFKTEFITAANAEHAALKEKKMFIDADKNATMPDGSKPIPLFPLYTYKTDDYGIVIGFKMRLCGRGDLQATREDTYAATLAAQIFRCLIAIMCFFNLECAQMDVSNAFANARNRIPILCRGVDGRLLWAIMALYGFKTSPNYWQTEFNSSLRKLGLEEVLGTNCVFRNDWLILIYYVDDILAFYKTEDSPKWIEFKHKLMVIYKIKDLGDASTFVGAHIIRNRDTRECWLLQDKYIEKLKNKYDVKITGKTPTSPLPSNELVPNTAQATGAEIFEYQGKVGSVNYAATQTRPDIAFSCSTLSRYLTNPSSLHLAAVNHLLCYLVATQYYALYFHGGEYIEEQMFLAASDSSFADSRSRKSSYGFLFKLFGAAIHWQAIKGSTVTTSSTEAELLAVSLVARFFLQWIRFFKGIHFRLDNEPTIYCDNRQTILLLQKEAPKLQTALRHVDIHQSWLRQEVQAGRITIEWMSGNSIPPDGLTKLLFGQKHREFVRQLGLRDIKQLLDQIKSQIR